MGTMVKKYEKQKAAVVMMSDFNFTWDVRSRLPNTTFEGEPKERSENWKIWATEYMGYVNVCSDLMKTPTPTFQRSNFQDDKDMILVKPELRDTAVIGVGIIDCNTADNAPSNS